MNIYLIRHGETDWNKQLKIQGQIDNPLNELGENQARELATHFEGISADVYLHSSLSRARDTFLILKDELNLEVEGIVDDSFIERNFGALEGQAIDEYYATTDFSKVDGYEQDDEIQARILAGFKKYQQYDNIVIVCHSHVIKSAIILTDKEKYNYSNTKLKNCCIAKFSYDNDELKLVEIR